MEKNKMDIINRDQKIAFRPTIYAQQQEQSKFNGRLSPYVVLEPGIDKKNKSIVSVFGQITTMDQLIKKVKTQSTYLQVQINNIFSFLAFLGDILHNFNPKKVKINGESILVASEQRYKYNLLLFFEKQSNLQDLGKKKQKRYGQRSQSSAIKYFLQTNQQFKCAYNFQEFCYWIKFRLLETDEEVYLLQFLESEVQQPHQILLTQYFYIFFGFTVWEVDRFKLLIVRKFKQQKILIEQMIRFDQNILNKVTNGRFICLEDLKVVSTNKDLQVILNECQFYQRDCLPSNIRNYILYLFQSKNRQQIRIKDEDILNNKQIKGENRMQSMKASGCQGKSDESEFYYKSMRRPQRLQNDQNFVEYCNSNFRLTLMSQDCSIATEGKVHCLRWANQFLRHQDMLMLRGSWNTWLKQFLQQIQQHFDIYELELGQELMVFVKLLEFRLQKIDGVLKGVDIQQKQVSSQIIYQIVFSGVGKLIKLLLKKLGSIALAEQRQIYVQNQKCANTNDSLIFGQVFNEQLRKILNFHLYESTENEKLFLLRIKELAEKRQLKNYTQLGQKSVSLSISKFIQSNQDQYHMYQCYNKLDQVFGNPQVVDKQTNIEQRRVQLNKYNFFDDIEHEKIPSVDCLGCCRFFYKDMNIYEPTLINYPLKVFPRLEQLGSIETLIKDTICGMLNSGGGVILFDCEQSYQNIRAKGIRLTEKDKQGVQHKLGFFFQNFYPKITLNQVSLSFVPVYQNPFTENHSNILVSYEGEMASIKQNQYYYKRIPIPGQYVARLVISPIERKVFFYWPKCKQLQTSYFCNKYGGGQHQKVQMRSISKQIKRSFKKFNVPNNLSELESRMMKIINVLDHKCMEPEAGNPIGQAAKRSKSQLGEEIRREQLFENIILMVCTEMAKVKTKRYIQEKIKRSMKFRIEAQIFPKYKFERAVNTFLFYHNQKFQVIFEKLREYKICELINVLHSLRIEVKRYDEVFFDNFILKIRENVEKEFPNQNIKLQILIPQNKRGKNEYYITTGTKEAALFVYFLIGRDFKDVSVYFKYPDKFNKLSNEQIFYKRKQYVVRKIYNQSQIFENRVYASVQEQFVSKWNEMELKRRHKQNKFKQTCHKSCQ